MEVCWFSFCRFLFKWPFKPVFFLRFFPLASKISTKSFYLLGLATVVREADLTPSTLSLLFHRQIWTNVTQQSGSFCEKKIMEDWVCVLRWWISCGSPSHTCSAKRGKLRHSLVRMPMPDIPSFFMCTHLCAVKGHILTVNWLSTVSDSSNQQTRESEWEQTQTAVSSLTGLSLQHRHPSHHL